MGELVFVGLGLHDEWDISLRGLQEIGEADAVFAEFYTSLMPGLFLQKLERLAGKEVSVVSRRILEEEKESIKKAFFPPYPVSRPDTDIERVEYVLEAIHSQPKNEGLDTSSIDKEFRDIETLLRLFKRGRMGLGFVRTEAITWKLHSGISYGWNPSRLGRLFVNSYELKKSEKLV